MTKGQKIIIIKLVHTIIYIVMVAAIFYILYAGFTKTYDLLLYISLALLVIETVVYFGNGKVCPFTDLAQKYGDKKGYVGDLFMPKSIADKTFYIFGSLFLLGILLLLVNLMGLR